MAKEAADVGVACARRWRRRAAAALRREIRLIAAETRLPILPSAEEPQRDFLMHSNVLTDAAVHFRRSRRRVRGYGAPLPTPGDVSEIQPDTEKIQPHLVCVCEFLKLKIWLQSFRSYWSIICLESVTALRNISFEFLQKTRARRVCDAVSIVPSLRCPQPRPNPHTSINSIESIAGSLCVCVASVSMPVTCMTPCGSTKCLNSWFPSGNTHRHLLVSKTQFKSQPGNAEMGVCAARQPCNAVYLH